MTVQETVLIHHSYNECDDDNGEEVFVPAHEEPDGMYFAHVL
jgi:hypothetical protein